MNNKNSPFLPFGKDGGEIHTTYVDTEKPAVQGHLVIRNIARLWPFAQRIRNVFSTLHGDPTPKRQPRPKTPAPGNHRSAGRLVGYVIPMESRGLVGLAPYARCDVHEAHLCGSPCQPRLLFMAE